MWRSPEPRYDIASGLSQGGRDYQEDAIVTDFPFGMDSGLAVLADGMGGHEAGDVASKIVVTEVYSELKFCSATFADEEHEIPTRLLRATQGANETIRDYVKHNPAARGMGATLVSVVLVENRMHWMSVGDSPLYLLRGGKLQQLNEDHSLAPQIDFMVQQGILSEEAGRDHPDRNCLTSVIMGTEIAKSDCTQKPFELQLGDIVVVSSDGLQYLEDQKIQKILHRYRRKKSSEIAGYLLEAIAELGDPDQDNVSFSVIKLNHMKPVERKIKPKPIGETVDPVASLTRVVPLAVADDASDAPKKDAASADDEKSGEIVPIDGDHPLAAENGADQTEQDDAAKDDTSEDVSDAKSEGDTSEDGKPEDDTSEDATDESAEDNAETFTSKRAVGAN